MERVIVSGPAVRVGIIGAYLAAKWAGEGREVILSPDTEARSDEVLLRPGFKPFHAEVGLAADVLEGGKVALGTRVETASGPVTLPFTPFGLSNGGVDFHHFWQRANTISEQPELEDYSLARALEGRTDQMDLSRLPVSVGMRLPRAKYASALIELAQARGAKVVSDGDPQMAQLCIHCENPCVAQAWDGGVLRVFCSHAIDGIEPLRCLNAAKRLVALMADLHDNAAERGEYNRLAANEAERIADMVELLGSDDPAATQRAALKRKIDLFEACGRIPTEDFEVFTKPEWLAALWARGIRPRRNDRLANVMPEPDLLNWLSALRQQIGQLSGEGLDL